MLGPTMNPFWAKNHHDKPILGQIHVTSSLFAMPNPFFGPNPINVSTPLFLRQIHIPTRVPDQILEALSDFGIKAAVRDFSEELGVAGWHFWTIGYFHLLKVAFEECRFGVSRSGSTYNNFQIVALALPAKANSFGSVWPGIW